MNGIIREKRKISFSYKRITTATLVALSDIIESEISLLVLGNSPYYVLYSADATDNTSFESGSNYIFKEGEVVDRRIINKVTMHFYALDNSKHIEVQIMHSIKNENLENFLKVSGDDSTWVNGTLARLNSIINSSQQQLKINHGFRLFILGIIVVLFNIQAYRILSGYNIHLQNDVLLTFYVLFIPLGSLIGAVNFQSYMDKLWPVIEIQAGPEHLNDIVKKRKRLKWVVGMVVLPILLSAAYDLLKALM